MSSRDTRATATYCKLRRQKVYDARHPSQNQTRPNAMNSLSVNTACTDALVSLNDESNESNTLNTKGEGMEVSIFEFGPWRYLDAVRKTAARYVIGQSRHGFHWDTEFVFGEYEKEIQYGMEKSCLNHDNSLLNWSEPCNFLDLAINYARRDIAIKSKNVNLDVTTKVKIKIDAEHADFRKMSEIPLSRQRAFCVNQCDLQRLALYNSYLSWSEFEQGMVDFSTCEG
ncbi:MAG: hypothetical protein ACI9Y1_001611 [Lentisphaeria bacterium]|jgi:hypothetical protein